jgi:hypothetical protein
LTFRDTTPAGACDDPGADWRAVGAVLLAARLRHENQRLLHRSSGSKTGLRFARERKAASDIERLRSGVCGDVQRVRTVESGPVFGLAHKEHPDAVSPCCRIHEQAVQLDFTVVSTQHDGKSDDLAVAFGDTNAAAKDLLKREFDCIGMGQN